MLLILDVENDAYVPGSLKRRESSWQVGDAEERRKAALRIDTL